MGVATIIQGVLAIAIGVKQANEAKRARRKAREAALNARAQDIRAGDAGTSGLIPYGYCYIDGSLAYINISNRFVRPEGEFGTLSIGESRRSRLEYLLAQYCISSGGIDGVHAVLINDQLNNNARAEWIPFSKIEIRDGSEDGAEASFMASSFTGERDHQSLFADWVYATCVFHNNPEDPKFGAPPIPGFFVRGRKTRSNVFSRNAVYALQDYLTSGQGEFSHRWGPGLQDFELDVDSFNVAATKAGESVQGEGTVRTGDGIPDTFEELYPGYLSYDISRWGYKFLRRDGLRIWYGITLDGEIYDPDMDGSPKYGVSDITVHRKFLVFKETFRVPPFLQDEAVAHPELFPVIDPPGPTRYVFNPINYRFRSGNGGYIAAYLQHKTLNVHGDLEWTDFGGYTYNDNAYWRVKEVVKRGYKPSDMPSEAFEELETPTYVDPSVSGSSTTAVFHPSYLARYEYNGVIDSQQPYREAIQQILLNIPGAQFFRTFTGKYKVVIPPDTTPENPPVIDDDLLTSDVTYAKPGIDARYNEVKILFSNQAKNFAADSILYPQKGTVSEQFFREEDGGLRLPTEVRLPGCSTVYHAHSIAANIMTQSRRARYSFETSHQGILYEPGDVVHLQNEAQAIDVLVVLTEVKPNFVGSQDAQAWTVSFEAIEYNPIDYSFIPRELETVDNAPIDTEPPTLKDEVEDINKGTGILDDEGNVHVDPSGIDGKLNEGQLPVSVLNMREVYQGTLELTDKSTHHLELEASMSGFTWLEINAAVVDGTKRTHKPGRVFIDDLIEVAVAPDTDTPADVETGIGDLSIRIWRKEDTWDELYVQADFDDSTLEIRSMMAQAGLQADALSFEAPSIPAFAWLLTSDVDVTLDPFKATGGNPEITYSMSNLPTGLSFDAATRRLHGTTGSAIESGDMLYSAAAPGYLGITMHIPYTVSAAPPLPWQEDPNEIGGETLNFSDGAATTHGEHHNADGETLTLGDGEADVTNDPP